MKKIFLNSAQPTNLALGLLLIRIIIGVLMAFYGYEKLIHFNEMAVSDFWSKYVNFLGFTGKIPLTLTIFAEFFCSLFLIIGLFTRLSLIPLIICMGFIILSIEKFQILNKGDNGFEISHAFLYFIIYVALFFTGSGQYSLDYKITKK